jgi:hypothetical protein
MFEHLSDLSIYKQWVINNFNKVKEILIYLYWGLNHGVITLVPVAVPVVIAHGIVAEQGTQPHLSLLSK